jgi:hypothetical protein
MHQEANRALLRRIIHYKTWVQIESIFPRRIVKVKGFQFLLGVNIIEVNIIRFLYQAFVTLFNKGDLKSQVYLDILTNCKAAFKE